MLSGESSFYFLPVAHYSILNYNDVACFSEMREGALLPDAGHLARSL